MSCWRFQMPACSPSPSPSQSPSQSPSSIIFCPPRVSSSPSFSLSGLSLSLPPSFYPPPPSLPLQGKPPYTRHIKAHMHLLVMLSTCDLHISAYFCTHNTYICIYFLKWYICMWCAHLANRKQRLCNFTVQDCDTVQDQAAAGGWQQASYMQIYALYMHNFCIY